MTIPISWASLFWVLLFVLGLLIGAWAMYDRPKDAHWIDEPDEQGVWYVCSNCDEGLDFRSMYCPHCGRRMREDVE